MTRVLKEVAKRVKLTHGADGIAQVTLARPNKLNSLDMDMFRAIQSVQHELISTSRNIRAVVVHGDGRAFCAGLDIKSVCGNPLTAKANMNTLLHRPEGEVGNLAQDVGYLWRRIPAPVIAVTHGVCLGGGLQIALGCDMRIAAPKCKFSVMEAKWGLVPDMSGTVTLRELVPKDVALELTLTGRIFEAAEALQLGLVTRIAKDPLSEALRLAGEIATRSPDASAAAKRLIHATFSSECSEARALHIESELQKQLIGGWNQMACAAKGLGAPAWLQPAFADRSPAWDSEADEATEAELRRLLDGTELTAQPAAAA